MKPDCLREEKFCNKPDLTAIDETKLYVGLP